MLITINKNFIYIFTFHFSFIMNYFCRDAFLDCDYSSCVSVGKALHTLQGLHGNIPHVLSHGRAAQAVINALQICTDHDPPKSSSMSHVSKFLHYYLI